jgi:hypothetical protein
MLGLEAMMKMWISRLNFFRRTFWVIVLIAAGWNHAARAAVHDLADDYVNPPSTSPSTNPSGPWTYGYMSSGGSFDDVGANRAFIMNSTSSGFVAYNQIGSAGGGGGNGWTTSFGFPLTGVWHVPPTVASLAPYPGLTDFPSAEGDNPAYPNGVLGGHAPNCIFCTGWYAVKYTAAATETLDLDIDAWQTAIYPGVPPNPLFGGATRPQQILIQKQSGSTFTNMLRAPVGTRHGVTNRDGTPEHTAADAPEPGKAESYATQQDEINAAMRSSANPNRYRLTGVQLNAGESLIISYAPYQGQNHVGFLGFNAVVRTGADRVATSRWDLADDWSVHGTSATGIGPNAAWSYGILRNGNFSAYNQIMFGMIPEDTGTTTRENHGWGTQEPGWFTSEALDVATGPITPGMMKDSDGVNALTGGFSGGTFSQPPTGDWGGSKVVLHTPSAEVDAAQTSVIRWTAPRSMLVDASGALWRATLPDDTDRRHQFKLLHNGAELASGTIDELGFDCGAGDTNSACPVTFNVVVGVATGDTLDLRISPLQTAGAPAGDYNGDGVVDAADYVVWRKTDGTPAGYTTWKTNFGATGGPGTTASPSFVGVDFTVVESLAVVGAASVPEPTTLFFMLIAALFGLFQRRRSAA